MMDKGEIILSTAYLPPIEYISLIARSGKALIDGGERYQKQTYRSRCHIYSGNGILPLTIPIIRSGSGHIKEASIDNSKGWYKNHWKAIESAYSSTPFFEYYKDDFVPFFTGDYSNLFDYNLKLTELILELCSVKAQLIVSDISYPHDIPNNFSGIIHPKRDSLKINKGQYYQVFAPKYGFIYNLSAIDLLFNEGPNAISYLI